MADGAKEDEGAGLLAAVGEAVGDGTPGVVSVMSSQNFLVSPLMYNEGDVPNKSSNSSRSQHPQE